MRISRKYLLRYWWHSVRYMTRRERWYWIIVLTYSALGAAYITYVSTWWLGGLLFLLAALQARFPMDYRIERIGKYPFSERKYYRLVPRKTPNDTK